MSYNVVMTLFWIIIVAGVLWFILKKKSPEQTVSVITPAIEQIAEITEDHVFKIQNLFENKLNKEMDFPDGIRGRDSYVYRFLMAEWFKKLSGLNRYNDIQIKKIRLDWVDYIEALQDRATYGYLWMENEGEKGESYRESHVLASQKMFAIEDGFASSVGEDAVRTLSKVREMDSSRFSRRGEMAPKGQRYNFMGELVPDKD